MYTQLTISISVIKTELWIEPVKLLGLQRCGKSCRLRWINYLRPDLKRGNITAEEEALIIRLHASMGNRWSLIAGHLPGRTDNDIKNYWNSHLSRKHLTELTDPNDKATEPVGQAEVTAKWKPRRGRSRKRGNIKNMSTNVPVKDMNMSMSMLGNEELDPIAAEKAMPPDADKESFEITAYINEEGAENTPSMNAEESLVFTSVHQPCHFNDDHIDILFTLDDALNIKVEETEVDSNLSSVDQKTKLLSEEADKVAANWNESKSLSISSAGDAWDDLVGRGSSMVTS
ncbi:unnamed protein product [Rhodiola kirilowii]